ncbi:MAG: hypothetical protein Q9188_007178 [Gyalolechia gomerana]
MAGQAIAMPVGQQTQPAGPPSGGQVQQYILRTLSQQPTPQGWQSSVQTQLRANIVFQIFSQLRLLQAQFELQYALHLAMGFEGKAFAESPDRNIYEQQCKRKMEEIHQMRTKQSAGMQQQMNQQMNMPQHMQHIPQAMAQNQGQSQGQFPHGLPNAQQQQMMQLQGMPMQQHQSQPQGRQQQQMTMGQRQPNVPQGQSSAPQPMAHQSNPYTPTPEENQYISQLAHQLFQSTPPHRLQAIQNNMRGMTAEQRESLSRQSLDPMAFFFRTQATKKFLELKRSQAGASGVPAFQPSAMVNGMARPSQNTGRPMGQQTPGPQQGFEPPFDQIIGQQQDALRSQEAGQVVVPASNPQANLDQRNAARANAQQQLNMQSSGNHSLQNASAKNVQSQPFWNPQAGQRNMNSGPGVNGNTQAANFPSASQAPSNVLQGQPGGLDNQITRTPSQTPGMPNLNKAAAPPGQTPNMWAQRTPQIGQAKSPGASLAPQVMQQSTERPEAAQQRPPVFQNMSAQMQQQLANMPDEQRRSFLMNLQRRQQFQQQQQQQQQQLQQHQREQAASQPAAKPANARAAVNESFSISSQASQPGMVNGSTAALSSQTMAVPQPMMQKNSGLQSSFPQQPGGLSRQQPAPGQPPPPQRGTPQHHGNTAKVPAPLTNEQVRQMDQKVFPAEMLSKASQLAQLPKEVKTWRQLKDFVSKNASSLPPGTSSKLEHLQAVQYRSQQQEPRPTRPGPAPAGVPHQQAPFAQMVSQPNMQAPVTAPRPPNMMNMPPPSVDEIQAMRVKLPPNLKAVSDAQVMSLIMRSKQSAMARNMQAQAQAFQNGNGISRGQQGQPNQAQGQSGQSNVSLHQHANQTRSPGQQTQNLMGQAVKQGQMNRSTPATKQSQKGVKRNSPDDVVEVPNPSLSTARTGAHGQSSAQATKQQPVVTTQAGKVPANAPASSFQRDLPSNRSQGMEAQNARAQGIPNVSKEELDQRRDVRLKQLMTEVGQNQPSRRPVPMSAQVKAQMAHKLRDFGPMIQRMESSFPAFFRNHPDETVAKELIQIRQSIKAQYRDAQFNLVDQFTISPSELEDASHRIRQYFVYVMRMFGKRPNNPSQTGEQQQDQRQSQQPTSKQEKAQLSAANLKEQQNMLQAQRAAAMQKHHPGHGSRVPPAPTSDKPPFPLDPRSPHGIPHYGPATLTADQLVLPVPKRRKSNHYQPSAGSTPVPVQEAKSTPQAIKLASPEVPKANIPQMSFKCGVSSCVSGQKGFATQVELEEHNTDEHEPKEEAIEDPMEFALESMRIALGLDENGKSKVQKETLEGPKMKASLSSQSHMAIKQEVSTPMARASTQTGQTPASNLLKTPQTLSGIKSPASDARSTVQEGKAKNGKRPETLPKEITPPPLDFWAGSSISSEDIVSAWSSIADMNSMSFTKIQMGLTPSSTFSSSNEKSEKNSPRPSDISENDAVKINIDVGNEDKDDWIPSEWFEDSLYGDIESLNFGRELSAQDNMMNDMDWDIFGDASDTVMIDVGAAGSSGGKGKRRDEDVISKEWLKMYAPERPVVERKR